MKKNKIANIVVVNVLIVTVLLLLFRPAFKCDDYYMASIVYGVYSNVYDPHILYMNAAIGIMAAYATMELQGLNVIMKAEHYSETSSRDC